MKGRTRGRKASSKPSSSSPWHGEFSEALSPYPVRVKRIEIPLIKRERISGLVGPELDFSATRNIVPKMIFFSVVQRYHCTDPLFKFAEELQRLTIVDESRVKRDKAYGKRYAETRPKPGFMNTTMWNSRAVGLWTRLASLAGVSYQGPTGYKIQLQNGRDVSSKQLFKQSCRCGLAPTHVRSESARIRRSLERERRRGYPSSIPKFDFRPLRLVKAEYRSLDKDHKVSWSDFRKREPISGYRIGKTFISDERGMEMVRHLYRFPPVLSERTTVFETRRKKDLVIGPIEQGSIPLPWAPLNRGPSRTLHPAGFSSTPGQGCLVQVSLCNTAHTVLVRDVLHVTCHCEFSGNRESPLAARLEQFRLRPE